MKKYHWPEALASVAVAGLGQILRGESEKGLKIILILYFALPAAVYLSMTISGFLFLASLTLALALGLIIWGYSVCGALLS